MEEAWLREQEVGVGSRRLRGTGREAGRWGCGRPVPSPCADRSKEAFLHQPPARSLQAALARVVPSFLPRATTLSTESGSLFGSVEQFKGLSLRLKMKPLENSC